MIKLILVLVLVYCLQGEVSGQKPAKMDVQKEIDLYTKCKGKRVGIPPKWMADALVVGGGCVLEYKDYYCQALCLTTRWDNSIDKATKKLDIEKMKAKKKDVSGFDEEKDLLIAKSEECQADLTLDLPPSDSFSPTPATCPSMEKYKTCMDKAYKDVCQNEVGADSK